MSYFDTYTIKDKIKDIQEMYLADKRPWIVGYSGGKDSSTVTQLIFEALLDLKKNSKVLHKHVYIISADTMVETPMIIDFISNTLTEIEKKAKHYGLPITSHQVRPKINESFWSLLIGKGYPSPRQKFRWCTDRLKIKPTTDFIKEKINTFKEVIIILGVRIGESASRNQILNNTHIEGKKLRLHNSLNNAYVYSPIDDFNVNDVWTYLLQHNEGCSPWGTDNNKLFMLYKDSDSECPLVIDENSPSCGNSRFGCWVCTVVSEDKSLKGFINSGEKWLKPLLNFRNWLYKIRNNREYREKKRRNGSLYTIERDGAKLLGLGPFKLEKRKEILEKLLVLQKELNKRGHNINLITVEELKYIRYEWIMTGDWNDSLPKIYKKVMGETLPWSVEENHLFDSEEIKLLHTLCIDEGVDEELMQKLTSLEAEYLGYDHRYMIYKKLDNLLKQDWLHYEEIKGLKTPGVDENAVK